MTKKKRRTIGKKCNERIRKSRKMQWKGNNTHSHTHTLTPLLKGKWQFWCPSPVGSFNLWHRSFYYHLTWSLWHFPHFPPELTIVVILEENCSIWKLYPFIRASLPTHSQLSSAFSSSFLLFFLLGRDSRIAIKNRTFLQLFIEFGSISNSKNNLKEINYPSRKLHYLWNINTLI